MSPQHRKKQFQEKLSAGRARLLQNRTPWLQLRLWLSWRPLLFRRRAGGQAARPGQQLLFRQPMVRKQVPSRPELGAGQASQLLQQKKCQLPLNPPSVSRLSVNRPPDRWPEPFQNWLLRSVGERPRRFPRPKWSPRPWQPDRAAGKQPLSKLPGLPRLPHPKLKLSHRSRSLRFPGVAAKGPLR